MEYRKLVKHAGNVSGNAPTTPASEKYAPVKQCLRGNPGVLSDWGNHEKARGTLGYLSRVPLISFSESMQSGAG